jgi:hypothetical protein
MWVCAIAYLSQARYFSQGVHPLSGAGLATCQRYY